MLVTKQAPDFTATAIMGDNSFKDISLSDYRGKKVVLFFYPLDFTFEEFRYIITKRYDQYRDNIYVGRPVMRDGPKGFTYIQISFNRYSCGTIYWSC